MPSQKLIKVQKVWNASNGYLSTREVQTSLTRVLMITLTRMVKTSLCCSITWTSHGQTMEEDSKEEEVEEETKMVEVNGTKKTEVRQELVKTNFG